MLGGNRILGLNEAAGVLPRPDRRECNIAFDRPKERNPLTNEHRHTRDNQR